MIYSEFVKRETFDALKYNKRFEFRLKLRRRYARFIPPQAFAIGEDVSLLVEAPTKIRFWAFGRKPIVKDIRITYLINDEIEEPYLKIYFK